MKLLFSYLSHYKKPLLAALVLAVINIVFSLLDTQVFRILFDEYIFKYAELAREDFIRGVILLVLLSMGAALVSRIAKNFQDYYVNVTTQKVGTELYANSVSHSFSLPFRAFEDQRSGELLGKLQKARSDSERLIRSFIDVVFLSVIGLVFVIGYAFYVHPYAGIAYTLTVPFLGITIYYLTKRIKVLQKKIVRETAALAGSTTETLRNVELVKSLGLEDQEIDRLNNVNDQILGLEIGKIRVMRTLMFIQGTLINTTRSAIFLLLIYLILDGGMTIGEFFALWFYSFAAFNPLSESGRVATEYQEAKASMEALEEVLAMQPEERPDSPTRLQQLTSIAYDKTNFTYRDDGDSAKDRSVRDISAKVSAGETIAFVGPSGAGKSTLMKLLVGLYKPTAGAVLVNETPLVETDLPDYRRRIGYVSQDTQLFAGSIRENLLFVKPEASDAECMEALNAAEATGIVERGDKGLATKIGEGGLKLSGGERQRLAIARALLRGPELLVFDEATSSLDSLTEKSITETIKKIAQSRPNMMLVLVAHRLSTVAHANRIYVLEKGAIVESGPHKELLQKAGLYAALWRQQQAQSD